MPSAVGPTDCGRGIPWKETDEKRAYANIVNRLTSFGGIQLEQSKVLRDAATLANAVADGAAEGFADFAANSAFNYCTGL